MLINLKLGKKQRHHQKNLFKPHRSSQLLTLVHNNSRNKLNHQLVKQRHLQQRKNQKMILVSMTHMNRLKKRILKTTMTQMKQTM